MAKTPYEKHVQILSCTQRVDERHLKDKNFINDYLKHDMARALARGILDSEVYIELPMKRTPDNPYMFEAVWHVAVVDQEKTKEFSDQLMLAEEIGRQKCIGTVSEAINQEVRTKSQTAGRYHDNTQFLAGMRWALERVRSVEIK